jgi:MerR family mercuric resistance operon transcriptional regulator
MATIGEASKRSGVGIEAIRFYERSGIIPAPHRTAGGRRDYGDEEIRNLRLVRRCRDLGFSLKEITQMLALTASDGPSCAKVASMAEQNLVTTAAKLKEFEALQAALIELIGHCRVGNESCPALAELLRD